MRRSSGRFIEDAVETLEPRRLLATTVTFSPALADAVVGTVVDRGLAYGTHDGEQFGWREQYTHRAVDVPRVSGSPVPATERNRLQNSQDYLWEFAVEDGAYQVTLNATGPAVRSTGMGVSIEGQAAAVQGNRFRTYRAVVSVSDGNLTLKAGDDARGIWFSDVTFESVATLAVVVPTVGFTSGGVSVNENGSPLTRTMTRSDTSGTLTVKYAVTGAARNGVDISTLSGAAVFANGQASVDLRISPINDSSNEGDETVEMSILPDAAYNLPEAQRLATVDIVDDEAPATGTLLFRTDAVTVPAFTEAAIAAYDYDVYTFGGYDNSFNIVDRVIKTTTRADGIIQGWTELNAMPVHLTHSGIAQDGGEVWFVGGYRDSGSGTVFGVSDTWVYTVATDSWRTGPALPITRAAAGMVRVGRSLYFFGGENNGRTMDGVETFRLNLDDTAAGWTRMADMPLPSNSFGYAALDGKVYAVGRQTGHDDGSDVFAYLQVYDVASNTWSLGPGLPGNRSHNPVSTFARDGRIVTIGGLFQHNEPYRSSLDFNPLTGRWRTLGDMPEKRLSPVAAPLPNGRVLVVGGYGGRYGGVRTQALVGEF